MHLGLMCRIGANRMTLKENILLELKKTPGQTDTELEKKFGVRHQAVNKACRELVAQGEMLRDNSRGTIKNYLHDGLPIIQEAEEARSVRSTDKSGLHEDSIKEILDVWLKNDGWDTEVAWGKKRGVDILALRGNEKWIIEVKGCGSLNAMRVNYFLAILGETLQRMDDDKAKYSIALPNLKQFRNLWSRLPKLAKERTKIDAIFVSEDGEIVFGE
jgi:hypothetical protein